MIGMVWNSQQIQLKNDLNNKYRTIKSPDHLRLYEKDSILIQVLLNNKNMIFIEFQFLFCLQLIPGHFVKAPFPPIQF